MSVGNDHQFCGDTILTLIREVRRLQAKVLDVTNVMPGLSPEADRIINTAGVRALSQGVRP